VILAGALQGYPQCGPPRHLEQVGFVLDKARFFDHFGDQLNERQRKALDAVFRRGQARVARGITPKAYRKITRSSPRTAGRDIPWLVEMGAISKVPGTAIRNARYAIVLPDPVPGWA